MKDQLIPRIAESIRENWESPALSDFQGVTYTYKQVAEKIAQMHLIMRAIDLKPGERVALCAKNSAEWAVAFLGTITYGAVAVPILHEFSPENIEHLVNHCGARILFSEAQIVNQLDEERLKDVDGVILLPELNGIHIHNEKLTIALESLDKSLKKIYPDGISPETFKLHTPENADSLALINYTSGSTGNSKGVMLSYTNLWSNVLFALKNIPFLKPGDGMVSMLPLAHMYGLVFEFLFPLCRGCHITFLGRVPSPKVVMQAFAQVRPKLIITVPLVIEKIVKTKVWPALQKPAIKFLLAIPGLRNIVYKKVRNQMLDSFGGNLEELIMGGAALSDEVEDFLRKIKFPFTIGYGMTECAPLLTYCWWADQRPHSCGKMVDDMQARVNSTDPANIPGVLFVKGPNVMHGYFKNEKATKETLSDDGWLNTGDICTIDADGYVYLRGRDKNMILGPSGQNIYPEEIEVKINNMPLVEESVVVDRDGKIVALVHPNYDDGAKLGLTEEQVNEKVKGNLKALNAMLPGYSRVSLIEIQPEPFEKTPKHSIRRFIYK